MIRAPVLFIEGDAEIAPALAEVARSLVPGPRFFGLSKLERFPDHSGLAGRDLGAAYFTTLAPYLLRPTNPLVVCRSWQSSEAVQYRLGAGRRRMLERLALGLGAITVWTYAKPGWSLEPHVTQRSHETFQEVVARALRVHDQYPVPANAPGCGAWHPEQVTLLVGEAPNDAKHGTLKHRLPFVSMHAGGCSLWLADRLEETGVGEGELYWVNAYAADGTPTDPAFLDALLPRRVVALGLQAVHWLESSPAWVPWLSRITRQVPHPAHWQRAHAGEAYPLAQALLSP